MNEFEGAKTRYYAVNGDIRGLTFNEMVILKTIAEDDTGSNKMECAEESGLPMMAVNESIRSLLTKTRISAVPPQGAVVASPPPQLPPSPPPAQYSSQSVSVPTVSKDLNPPDILIPKSLSSGSEELPPEIAAAITNPTSQNQLEYVDEHVKKDSKLNNPMDLMNGLSTGRLVDHINKKADFSGALETVGGDMSGMMEGLSLKMPSLSFDGTNKDE